MPTAGSSRPGSGPISGWNPTRPACATSSPWACPALLQTEEYARAVLRAAPDAGPGDPAVRRVALRMRRQAILARPSPPGLHVVIGEGALRAQTGGTAVMRAQLARLRRPRGAARHHPAGPPAAQPRRRGPGTPVHDPGLPRERRPAGRVPRAPHRRHVPRQPGRHRALRCRLRPAVRPGARPRRVGGPDRAARPRLTAALPARPSLQKQAPLQNTGPAPGTGPAPETGPRSRNRPSANRQLCNETCHNAARSGVRVPAVSGGPDPARYSAVSSSKRPPR